MLTMHPKSGHNYHNNMRSETSKKTKPTANRGQLQLPSLSIRKIMIPSLIEGCRTPDSHKRLFLELTITY